MLENYKEEVSIDYRYWRVNLDGSQELRPLSEIGGASVWGGITGDVTDQTDLMDYLAANYEPLGGGGGITGTGVDHYITYWTGASTVGGSIDFQFNSTTQAFSVSTGGNRTLLIDPSNSNYGFGDMDGIGQGGRVIISDQVGSKALSLITGGDVIRADLDGINKTFKWGDTTIQSNGTRGIIDDTNLRTDFYSQDFYFRGYNANVGIFAEITNTYSDVDLGDVSTANTGTRLRVLDSIGGIKMTGVFGDSFFADMSVNYVVSMGALGTGNGTKLVIDDTFGVTTIHGSAGLSVVDASLDSWFRVDTGNSVHMTTVGDVGGLHNETTLKVDDINSSILLHATGAVVFGNGYENVTPSLTFIKASNSTLVADNPGSSLIFQSGASTGSAASPNIVWQITKPGAPGSTLNTYETVLEISGVDGGLSICGAYRMPLLDGAEAGQAIVTDSNGVTTFGPVIDSGTYVPVSTALSNLDGNPTMTTAKWMRVGNVVTVSGEFLVDPTTNGVSCDFTFTLPIPTTGAANYDVAGVATSAPIANYSAFIMCVGGEADVQFVAASNSNAVFSYTLTYIIN